MIITVKQSDLIIRPFRGSGPGGQHRNTTMSSVEIIHKPTGIKATANMRSQAQSKKAALVVLLARLRKHYEPVNERWNVPDIRVRTYHESDNRVTDHGSGLRLRYDEVVGKKDLSKMIESRARWANEVR